MTITLIALNLASFVLQLTMGFAWEQWLIFAPAVGETQWWRFLTTAFLHVHPSPMHIGFNMVALWVVGGQLEPVLGRLRFTVLYLLSALGGSVMVVLLASPTSDAWYTGVVGASGAVFGLFGAVFIVVRRLGHSAQSIVVLLVVNGVIGFAVPNIAWQGHLGGLLSGLAIGAVFAYAPSDRRNVLGVVATVGLAAVLLLASVVKYTFT